MKLLTPKVLIGVALILVYVTAALYIDKLLGPF